MNIFHQCLHGAFLHGTVTKTLSFAVCHFTVAFTVAYLLTGNFGISSVLALVEPMCNTVAYFFHEKLWNRLQARKPLPGV